MARDRQIVRYRCMDCRHEFKAGPGPTVCPACGGLYVGRLSWHALMTQPRAEAAVRDRLKAAGHETLFLHYRVPVRRLNRMSRRQREAVAVAVDDKPDEVMLRPCLPRYVFIRLTPADDFYSIATMPGVADFVSSEAGPRRVPDTEIERLREWGDDDGCIPLEDEAPAKREERFEAGLAVRIKGDLFEGVGKASVVRDDGRMVTVYADMFGRRTEIVLAAELLVVA